MQQAFDSYPDGDGIVFITTDLELLILETLREIQAKDINHKMENGAFFLPQDIRQKMASIFSFFE